MNRNRITHDAKKRVTNVRAPSPPPPPPPPANVQYPTMRADYINAGGVFPAWLMPGIDFYVGAFIGGPTPRKTPESNSADFPVGVSVNPTLKQIYLNSASIVLTRWDFSGSGGWQIIGLIGCNAPVFNDCVFAAGTNLQPCFNMTGIVAGGMICNDCTLTGSELDMSDFDGLVNYVGHGSPGPIVFNRCDLNHSFDDVVQLGIPNGGVIPVTFNQCLSRNNSQGPASGSPHPDHCQLTGNLDNTEGTIFEFTSYNCSYIMNEPIEQGSQFLFLSDLGAFTRNSSVKRAVFVAAPETIEPCNFCVIADPTKAVNSLVIDECYIDPRNLLTPSQAFNFAHGTGPYNNEPTVTNCFNLNTGAPITH